jgi:hypothetical protein
VKAKLNVDRLARALHAVDAAEGRAVTDDFDFGPAEYMRHVYRKRAKATLRAARAIAKSRERSTERQGGKR